MRKLAQRTNRRLSVESLEGRAMMAGNITASVSGGSLNVQGDNVSNGVAIEQTAPNTFRVRTYSLGGAATLLNGSTDNIQTFFGVTTDVNITMQGGYDEVRVQHLNGGVARIGRNLNIDGGGWSDNVNVQALVGRSTGGFLIVKNATLVLSNSAVPKNLVLSNGACLCNNVTVDGAVSIFGTEEDDQVTLDALTAASLTIETLGGRDSVHLASKPQIAGNVNIYTGQGEDAVQIGSLSAQGLLIDLGPMNPSTSSNGTAVSIFGQSNIRHEVRINGSEGPDNMSIDGLHVADTFFASLGAGNDRLSISNSSSSEAVLDGGDGFDKLTLGSGNSLGQVNQSGFE
jgi:hypothetical protein